MQILQIRARRGQVESARKALAFVEQHPATMARDHLYNQPLLTELHSELAPAMFEEAAVWAAAQTLGGMVNWLLPGEIQLSNLSGTAQTDQHSL